MKRTLWERTKESVERIERGLWSEFDLFECADYVGWVAKFRKLPKSEWEPVCEKITELLELGYE